MDYSMFWYAPAGFAALVMVLFAFTFWDRSVDDDSGPDSNT
ncbi:MAG: hypothetical protein VXZ82_02740 [Planctomycetota bacterium]|nr:hypothetical protein [Planctomycetota bacterium]